MDLDIVAHPHMASCMHRECRVELEAARLLEKRLLRWEKHTNWLHVYPYCEQAMLRNLIEANELWIGHVNCYDLEV